MPRPTRDLYAWRIRRSGTFDREYYGRISHGINPLYRAFPIRHYTRFGESLGWQPNETFSPSAYLRLNPDLRDREIRPFEHYLRHGQAENRVFRELLDGGLAGDAAATEVVDLRALAARGRPGRSRFAVVIHLYYLDIWDEFETVLSEAGIEFDLFVTITHFAEGSVELRDRIRAAHPEAVVVLMPNHGRDIFPFVHLVGAGLLSGYEAVCKIHSKRSPHRVDGDAWRNHLVTGLLPAVGTPDLLEAFLDDPSASLWVADGQHYRETQWWGSNLVTTDHMLRRIEIAADPERLSFPAGSMYWLKPALVDMIRGLQLTETDFEPERRQVDGTTAHAFERALGYMAEDGGRRIVQTSQLEFTPDPPVRRAPSFVSAFYLPQFHRTPENDAWWGRGFTEWTAASAATRNFACHAQPQLPGALGFYDLTRPEVMGEQAAMARAAGIDAFCTYFYWFDGRRILEAPIDNLMDRPEIEFPFYLCWANESWRRNWDGQSGEVLLEQGYREGFESALARDTARYMRDPRYARPDGARPRFVIYRPTDMPDPTASVARLRAAWQEEGVGEVELGAVLFHVRGEAEIADDLFDFHIEMPPHDLVSGADYIVGGPTPPPRDFGLMPGFRGLIYDYRRVAENALSPEYAARLPANTIAGIMPSWDNTARRGPSAHIAWGANPMTFERWLERLCAERLDQSYRGEIIVNAWNEWAEKAMLEPSRQYGDAMLRVLERHSGAKAPGLASQTQ
ncbi:glycoside hydrolase family 99-like domain-containing protein [Jannaschia seosinensis]|nr:glycoside hydrolase family 99-like domain-containing protein [Jannaschia seosinensis]